MENLKSTRLAGIEQFESIHRGTARISRGDHGLAVRKLQDVLTELGFVPHRFVADGVFGDATEQALKTFQLSEGLRDDGVLSDRTLIALDDALLRIGARAEGLHSIKTAIREQGEKWTAGETLFTNLPDSEKRKYFGSDD